MRVTPQGEAPKRGARGCACATTVFVLRYMSVWQYDRYLVVCITWSKLMILSWRQWRSQGEREDICPRAQHFEGVNWGWNVT